MSDLPDGPIQHLPNGSEPAPLPGATGPRTHAERTAGTGPVTDPATLVEIFEQRGHLHPAGAWESYTAAWNWAAPLTTALPADGTPDVSADPGGYLLSGRWHLPAPAADQPWLALPLAGGAPDVFVVPAATLADTGDGTARTDGAFVPAGFTARSGGTALRSEDALFHWLAVASMALGAARRVIEESARADASGTAGDGPVDAARSGAADLVAVVAAERRAFTARARSAPGPATPTLVHEVAELAESVGRVAAVAHHAVALAYERSVSRARGGDGDPLEAVVRDSAPLLQHVRFVTELLPAGHPGNDER
ncbi:hypothetical protein KUM39_03895 [Streptomyces sp. J2-1]|uniref:hypothetical protein n=1 Tax=Streptomyces corallincola TaxID=2851888 RepID=UPI001C38C949|nr:hypothetical protein [Streptomyces corallincola]MBV2353506.1 hypothetical protein [Streptomyces corallincola]